MADDTKGTATTTVQEITTKDTKVNTIVQAKVSMDKTYQRDISQLRSEAPYNVDPEHREPRIFFGADPSREHWSNRVTYMIAIIATVCTLRNIYRFPLLAYAHGFEFVLVYLVCMGLFGFPLHVLMITIGIYAQRGLVKAWDAAPVAKGIGWAMFLLALLALWYLSFYGAYSLLYFGRCFHKQIPWQAKAPVTPIEKHNPFKFFTPVPNNTNKCYEVCNPSDVYPPPQRRPELDLDFLPDYLPSARYFWKRILRYKNFDQVWAPTVQHFKLLLAFLLTWAAISLIVWKGIVSVERMLFFLIPCIYFLGAMCLMVSFLLRNNHKGLGHIFDKFDGKGFGKVVVWRDALEQVLLELGICYGVPIIYGSFVNFPNRILCDSAVVCITSAINSFFSFIMMACVLGNVKYKHWVRWSDIEEVGAGFVYVVYFDGLTNCGGKHFWCASYGIFLFLVCLVTLIPPMLVVTTILYEQFPKYENKRHFKLVVYAAVCASILIIGIYLCFCKTFYAVHFLDFLPGLAPAMLIVYCFVVAILVYGIHKYAEDAQFATEWYPCKCFKYYLFVIPVLIIIVFLVALIITTYKVVFHGDEYAAGSYAIGWLLFVAILLPIPIRVVYWIVYSLQKHHKDYILRSKVTWGPKHILGRYARARFSSDP